MRAILAASIVRRAVGPALVVLLVCGAAWPAGAGTIGPGDVRPLQARGRTLLARGAERSATFEQLLEEIAASDVVVYVDLDPYEARALDGGLRLDGALQFLGSAAGKRYVKVWLRPHRPHDELDGLIVAFAHELRHAVEVARAPQGQERGFARAALSGDWPVGQPGRFETQAARDTAARVAAELRRPR